MLAALFGQDSVSGELAAAIHRETEGNPFFVEETVKALIDQGVIYRARRRVAPRRRRSSCASREGVRAAIARRLERLSAAVPRGAADRGGAGQGVRVRRPGALAATADEEALLDALDEARRQPAASGGGARATASPSPTTRSARSSTPA